MRLQGDALAAQAQVMGQQFFQRESLLRRMRARDQGRDIASRGGRCIVTSASRSEGSCKSSRDPAATAPALLGLRQAIQRLADQLAQRDRADAFDRGIDRSEAVR
jgi:hypothetical protein